MVIKKIAIIHTSPATVQSLTSLIKEVIGEIKVVNLLDDSILNDLINNNQIEFVEQRWLQYVNIAASMGVDAILSACSSVGNYAEKANAILDIPVYRIDVAMAEKAVSMGQSISVIATLPSTLEPTVKLVESKAKELNKECIIHTVLVKDAYDELMMGNREVHDQKIQKAVQKYYHISDVLVLAQASMATAVEQLEGIDKKKVLTSPKLGVEKLKKDLLQL